MNWVKLVTLLQGHLHINIIGWLMNEGWPGNWIKTDATMSHCRQSKYENYSNLIYCPSETKINGFQWIVDARKPRPAQADFEPCPAEAWELLTCRLLIFLWWQLHKHQQSPANVTGKSSQTKQQKRFVISDRLTVWRWYSNVCDVCFFL